MRILLVNSHGADLAFGGAERYVDDLRRGLEAGGDHVTVISAFPVVADRSSDLRVLHSTDWRTDRLRRLRTHAEDWIAPASRRLGALVREIAPDLVHTSNLFGITTGIWECADELGIPVVHTLHDYGLLCPRTSLMKRDGTPCEPHPLLCGLRTRQLMRRRGAVSGVIGVSAHLLAAHEGLFDVGTFARVIYPPLTPSAGADAPPPARDGLRTLGYLGALDLHKGVATLLAAAPRLRDVGVQLRIAGGGPMAETVAAAAGVDFAGRLVGDDVAVFLRECDAGIVPSLWAEPGLTFAALEWLGAGRPVLATSRGGLAELPDAGVMRIDGTPGELIGAVRGLGEPGAWQRLLAGRPAILPDDAVRWCDDHRRVYAQALAASGLQAA